MAAHVLPAGRCHVPSLQHRTPLVRPFTRVAPSRSGSFLCRADNGSGPGPTTSMEQPLPSDSGAAGAAADGSSVRDAVHAAQAQQQGQRRQAGSTDWIASGLTRRFGLAGGLAWLGFLSFGVIGEQVKTRLEVASEEANTRDVQDAREVVTPEGLRYTDLKIGGGSVPILGYLIVLNYKAYVNDQLFEDTTERRKPIVFLYGGRPFSGGMCLGVELALKTMRAGGRRRVTIPPELAVGITLRPTEHVPGKASVVPPPGSTLVYELSLERVSIPPS